MLGASAERPRPAFRFRLKSQRHRVRFVQTVSVIRAPRTQIIIHLFESVFALRPAAKSGSATPPWFTRFAVAMGVALFLSRTPESQIQLNEALTIRPATVI